MRLVEAATHPNGYRVPDIIRQIKSDHNFNFDIWPSYASYLSVVGMPIQRKTRRLRY